MWLLGTHLRSLEEQLSLLNAKPPLQPLELINFFFFNKDLSEAQALSTDELILIPKGEALPGCGVCILRVSRPISALTRHIVACLGPQFVQL